MNISFSLNGRNVAVDVEPEKRLIDIMRENLQLTGSKAGCYAGTCGVCGVLAGGRLAYSCLMPAFTVRGTEITTIEGFSRTREYGDITKAFAETEYYPCNYCRAGRILAVEALLTQSPDPSEREVLAGIEGITCQCADFTSLMRAVEIVAFTRKMRRRGRRT